MKTRWKAILAVAVVVAGIAPANHAATAPGAPRHDGTHVLVGFRPGVGRADRASTHRRAGARVVARIASALPIEVVRGGAGADQLLRAYRGRAEVAFAEPNYIRRLAVTPNDPRYPGNGGTPDLWALHNVGQSGGAADMDVDAPEGWDLANLSGSPWPAGGHTVGVIDTGVASGHADLAGRPVTPCKRATTGSGVLSDGCEDDNGHGTHVAGTIAAIGNNGTGVVGVAPTARVYACKALNAAGSGTSADFLACLQHMIDRRAELDIRVVNASLGASGASAAEEQIVQDAVNAGIVFVAASGNDGRNGVDFPAAYAAAVAVGAIDRAGRRPSFSNTGSALDLAAPGVEIVSTWGSSGYRAASGTSQAAPHVAGVAAMVSAVRGLSGQALRSAVEGAATDLGPAGTDATFGRGVVNLCRALGGTTACDAPPPPPPSPSGAPPPPSAIQFGGDVSCGDSLRIPAFGGGATSASLTAMGPDGTTVTMSASGVPAWADFEASPGNPATATLSGDPGLLDVVLGWLRGSPEVRVTATTGSDSAACDVTLFAAVA